MLNGEQSGHYRTESFRELEHTFFTSWVMMSASPSLYEPNRFKGRRWLCEQLIDDFRGAFQRAFCAYGPNFRTDLLPASRPWNQLFNWRCEASKKDWFFVRKEALVWVSDAQRESVTQPPPIGIDRSGARPGEGSGLPGPLG
jgi:hypothetical protein